MDVFFPLWVKFVASKFSALLMHFEVMPQTSGAVGDALWGVDFKWRFRPRAGHLWKFCRDVELIFPVVLPLLLSINVIGKTEMGDYSAFGADNAFVIFWGALSWNSQTDLVWTKPTTVKTPTQSSCSVLRTAWGCQPLMLDFVSALWISQLFHSV